MIRMRLQPRIQHIRSHHCASSGTPQSAAHSQTNAPTAAAASPTNAAPAKPPSAPAHCRSAAATKAAFHPARRPSPQHARTEYRCARSSPSHPTPQKNPRPATAASGSAQSALNCPPPPAHPPMCAASHSAAISQTSIVGLLGVSSHSSFAPSSKRALRIVRRGSHAAASRPSPRSRSASACAPRSMHSTAAPPHHPAAAPFQRWTRSPPCRSERHKLCDIQHTAAFQPAQRALQLRPRGIMRARIGVRHLRGITHRVKRCRKDRPRVHRVALLRLRQCCLQKPRRVIHGCS